MARDVDHDLMTRRDDLEATVMVAGEWDREQLAVYADDLLASGDPRGDLIVIDLRIDIDGATHELVARRRELLEVLLGPLVEHPEVRCRYGFLELDLDDESDLDIVAKLGPLGRYLRRVDVLGGAVTIASAIDALAITQRPWLTSLKVRDDTGPVVGPMPMPIVRTKSAAALARVTPRLDRFEVGGRGVFASFAHPTLRALDVTGVDAMLSLADPTELLPNVVELDLQLRCPRSGAQNRSDDAWIRYLPPVQFPALRRLDLARNPSPEVDDGFALDPFRFIRLAPITSQLTHLRLPAIATANELANAQAAIERAPNLIEVELPASEHVLRHPAAKVHARERWWRPLTRTLTNFVVGQTAIRVLFSEATTYLDHAYERMPADARAAWDHVWDVLLHQPRSRPRAVFAELLLRALDACDGRIWRELHQALRAGDHGPGVMVRP